MKIAFLSTFYPYRGGIAQFNAALFRELEKQHQVKLFNYSLQYPSFLFPGTTQYVTQEDNADELETVRSLNAVNPLTYISTAKKIEVYQPDLVIIGYWMPFMGPCLGYVAGKLSKKTKVVSIVHNAVPHETSRLDRLLSNYFFKGNTPVVALSEAVKKDIETTYPSTKVRVIHHPSYNHFGSLIPRNEALKKLELDPANKYLLFFGLIRAYKGLDVLLEALPHLEESFHLIIAGESYEDWAKYTQIIKKNNLEERIHLHKRYIPDDEVASFFSAADCCVLPYKSATQSGIIAISHAFHVPVVATQVGGLNEFIKNDANGVLIDPPVSPQKLANELTKLFESNKLSDFREELSENSTLETWESFAEKIVSIV